MARINLLPWREVARRRRRREFTVIAMVGLAATLLLGWVLHLHMEGLISGQQNRNRFLRNEIGRLDGQIREVRDLKERKKRLLGRMDVIRRLRMSRPELVHLFDELATGVPEGIYLTRISQSGCSVVLEGRARSSARISAFMRNIEASRWIGSPSLLLIEHQDRTGMGASHFRLSFEQLSTAGEEVGETGEIGETGAKT